MIDIILSFVGEFYHPDDIISGTRYQNNIKIHGSVSFSPRKRGTHKLREYHIVRQYYRDQ